MPVAAQTTWTGAGDGTSWVDAANWNNGAPGASANIWLTDLAPDAAQEITLSGLNVFSGQTYLGSTGDRDYTIKGGTLELLYQDGGSTPKFNLQPGGTGSLTIDSDVVLSNNFVGGVGSVVHDIQGAGVQTLTINGNISTGGGFRPNVLRVNTPNGRLNLSGSNTLGVFNLVSGEVVVYNAMALGNSQLQGGGSGAIISLASDLEIGGGSTSTFLGGNIDLRIREETLSNTDRVVNVNSRMVTSSGGVAGKITIVDNINSTGRVILNIKNLGGGNATYLPVDLGSTGLLRFSHTATGTYGPGGAGTGVISGAGDVEKVIGTTITNLLALNTYTGKTSVFSGVIAGNTLKDGGEASSIGASTSDAANLVLDGGFLRYIGDATSTNRLFTVGTAGGGLDASGTGAVSWTNTGEIGYAGSGARTFTLSGSETGSLAALVGNGAGGATSLTKAGTGTWTVSGANTYTGVTTISSGTLNVANLANGGSTSGIGASSANAENLVFGSGGTLRYVGSGTSTNRLFTTGAGISTIDASGSGALHFTNTGESVFGGSGTRTLVLSGTNTDLNRMDVSIAGAIHVEKRGSGTWLLSGTRGYTGSTTFGGGVLEVEQMANGSAASSIGAASNTASNIRFDGGTMRYIGAGNSTSRLFRISENGGEIRADGTGALEWTSAGSITFINAGERTLHLSGTNTGNNRLNAILGDNGGDETHLRKSGLGTWVISGNNTYTGATEVEGGRLVVSGNIAASSGVEVAAGAALSGYGSVSAISGAGLVDLGASAVRLTGESVDASGGLDFSFRFTTAAVDGLSLPTFNNASASGNSLLRLMDATPFAFDLAAGNIVNVDFTGLTLVEGDEYIGGFYSDSADFTTALAGATFAFTGLEGMKVVWDVVGQNADFGSGLVEGYVTRFTVVPEPGSLGLLVLTGVGALVWRARQRRS